MLELTPSRVLAARDRLVYEDRILPRVFLGTEDIGFCMSALARGFAANGVETTTMVTHHELNAPPGVTYDIVRGHEVSRYFDYHRRGRIVGGIARRMDAALAGAINGAATPTYLAHDVYIFFWKPWLPEPMLLPLLKRLGKKIIIYWLGSDVRHFDALEQEYGVDTRTWGASFRRDPLDAKVRRIRWSELYADLIYSVPDQSGLQIRPYFHARVPISIELESHVPARKKPVVLHAPAFDLSARGDIKGTSYVMESVETLRREGLEFDFQLLTGLQRHQVLEKLQSADIVVDELILHGPGALSAEAMMAGCAVATRVLDPAPAHFSPPVCAARPETVTAALRRLITDIPYRLELASQGPAWAREAFDPASIARSVLRHLDGEEMPHYVPRFYLDAFVPSTPLSRISKELGLRVAEKFRPETVPSLHEAAARGVVARPPAGRARTTDLRHPNF